MHSDRTPPVLITVTSDARGTSVYLDGKLAETSSRFVLSRLDLSGQLFLGASPMYDDRWSGQLRGFALYGRSLSASEISNHLDAWSRGLVPASANEQGALALYTFGEHTGSVIHDQLGLSPDLHIPRSYQIFHKPLLTMPWRDFRRDGGEIRDISINIAGFIPFGFFICAWFSVGSFRRHAALATIISGASISLCIEVLQLYLPTRTSSMTDVITNTLGACIGALLFRSNIVEAVLRRSAPRRAA